MTIRWGYALNQWDDNIDAFVRPRDHERALKTISISGFTGVELTAVSFGAWEPFGTPVQIAAAYGSLAEFRELLASYKIDAISSWFYDPFVGFEQEMGRGHDPLEPASAEKLAATAVWFAEALAQLGGSVLVMRPVGSAWQTGALDDAAIATLAACWEHVARAIEPHGIRLALHVDFLSALRLDDGIERLLAATDPGLVWLAVDTAELAIAGIDPVEFITAHAARVGHVHLKDARERVELDEALTAHAEHVIVRAGGSREIERWFFEPGDHRGLVDSEAVVAALVDSGYDGWVIVETDQSPHPAESVMLSGWQVQKKLYPLTQTQEVRG